MKSWGENFGGISTKCLCTYIYSFKFLEDTKKSNEYSKFIGPLKHCSKFDFRETVNTLRKRPHSVDWNWIEKADTIVPTLLFVKSNYIF